VGIWHVEVLENLHSLCWKGLQRAKGVEESRKDSGWVTSIGGQGTIACNGKLASEDQKMRDDIEGNGQHVSLFLTAPITE